MYGDLSHELILQAKRTQGLSYLPSYQTESVRSVTREVKDLDRDVTEILRPFGSAFDPSANPAIAYTLLVHHLCMRRNKRCLLAYHRVRVERIEERCWTGGGGGGGEGTGEHTTADADADANVGGGGDAEDSPGDKLSPEEEDYARAYADLIAAAKGRWTDIDLTGSLEPPRDLFVDVRVLRDAGEIQTEYGYVTFLAPTPHFDMGEDKDKGVGAGLTGWWAQLLGLSI